MSEPDTGNEVPEDAALPYMQSIQVWHSSPDVTDQPVKGPQSDVSSCWALQIALPQRCDQPYANWSVQMSMSHVKPESMFPYIYFSC